jgi:hypothetical protein
VEKRDILQPLSLSLLFWKIVVVPSENFIFDSKFKEKLIKIFVPFCPKAYTDMIVYSSRVDEQNLINIISAYFL